MRLHRSPLQRTEIATASTQTIVPSWAAELWPRKENAHSKIKYIAALRRTAAHHQHVEWGQTLRCPIFLCNLGRYFTKNKKKTYTNDKISNFQAPFAYYPWNAAVLDVDSNVFLGGGVLLDNLHVLTAAHKINSTY